MLLRLANQTSVALANARLHESIRALSLTDPLTDLPNRRHLDMHLRREVAAARRGRHVCVVLFDLNDFKLHNDRLGHVVGDQILRHFGRILVRETRAMNLAARYGGDEFITVLTDIPTAWSRKPRQARGATGRLPPGAFLLRPHRQLRHCGVRSHQDVRGGRLDPGSRPGPVPGQTGPKRKKLPLLIPANQETT